jgi:hypothetical protein
LGLTISFLGKCLENAAFIKIADWFEDPCHSNIQVYWAFRLVCLSVCSILFHICLIRP